MKIDILAHWNNMRAGKQPATPTECRQQLEALHRISKMFKCGKQWDNYKYSKRRNRLCKMYFAYINSK